MAQPSPLESTPRARIVTIALIWLITVATFVGLYQLGKHALIEEVRSHAMGVAIAVSEGLDGNDLNQVRSLNDVDKPAFQSVQRFLQRVTDANPDIRFIYTMRRSTRPDAADTDYEYIVDGPESDDNGNGVIDPDEGSEDPGTLYPADDYPAMVRAWELPGADKEITPDPPYPDMISGYAPVRIASGETVAIVGVDVIAQTIRDKLQGLRVGVTSAALLLGILLTSIVSLYWRQKKALVENRRLTGELSASNAELQAANQELARRNQQYREELKLAQTVQLGFLPETFPRQDRVQFDKVYMTCEIIGGDLFDVFEIDDRHVGVYVADVAGHGVSAALISGLLKMAMTTARDMGGEGNPELLDPSRLVRRLHDVIEKDIPDYDYITMLYGVLDLDTNELRMANAGHLYPIHYVAATGQLHAWEIPTGGAIGLLPNPEFENSGACICAGRQADSIYRRTHRSAEWRRGRVRLGAVYVVIVCLLPTQPVAYCAWNPSGSRRPCWRRGRQRRLYVVGCRGAVEAVRGRYGEDEEESVRGKRQSCGVCAGMAGDCFCLRRVVHGCASCDRQRNPWTGQGRGHGRERSAEHQGSGSGEIAGRYGQAASKRVQDLLGRIGDSNPDIRFIYTMRRSGQGNGGVWDYEYIVDEAADGRKL